MEEYEKLDFLNDALKESEKAALKQHAEYSQPIIYRDNENRLVEEYADGRIIIIKNYNKTT